MIIIKTSRFVAGIFADTRAASRCLVGISDYISDLFHKDDVVVATVEVQYPFYLLECTSDGMSLFIAYQTEAEAITVGNDLGRGIIYTIAADYQPPIPWTDHMGSLPHQHIHPEIC